MADLGNYLLESGVSLGIFYMLYWLLLRKQTYFGLNRLILFLTTILSLVLPFISIDLPAAHPDRSILYMVDQFSAESGIWLNARVTAPVGNRFTVTDLLLWIYLAGLAFFLLRFFVQLFQIVYLARTNPRLRVEGFVVVLTSREMPPFSFFRWIFIHREEWEHTDRNAILSHEGEHISRWHSLDNLLLEVMTIIQWFNPFAWMYKFTLRELHEYEADHGVIRKGTSTLNYQQLILQHVFGVQFFRFVNHLNQSYIKKRFAMMTKNRSRRTAVLRTLSIIPVTAALLALFAFNRNGMEWPARSSSPEGELAFVQPVGNGEQVSISAPYGPMMHPFEKKETLHKGIDFRAKEGTPVLAVAAGTIEQVALDETAYGHHLVIHHNDSWSSMYAHLDEIRVAEGDRVQAGQVIGTVGNTGLSTGPHLHLELIRDGENVDPAMYIPGLDNHRKKSVEKPAGLHAAPPANASDTPVVFKVVEVMPRFQGQDITAFRNWLIKEVRYPEKMKLERKMATVFVNFVVDEKGKVTGVRVLDTRDGNGNSARMPEFEEEAVRAVKSSPDWEPGTQRGEKVAVELTVPIRFRLDKEKSTEEMTLESQGKDEKEVFFVVEEMPSFTYNDDSSIDAFRHYIMENLRYPAVAAKAGLSGKVYISFVVAEDGSVTDVKLVRALKAPGDELREAADALNEEALRVVKESPRWTPGKQKGQAVRVAFTFPITFALAGKE